jgi:MraZ protein
LVSYRSEAALSNFIGTFKFAVDEKGRFSVPTSLRDGLASSADDTFVVHPGADQCLEAYPKDEWARRVQILRSLPGGRTGRYYRRLIAGEARPCKMDGHHRILVPPELLSRAGITDTVLIIGQLDHLEFWHPEKYGAYLAAQDVPLDDVLEEIEAHRHGRLPGNDESDRVR